MTDLPRTGGEAVTAPADEQQKTPAPPEKLRSGALSAIYRDGDFLYDKTEQPAKIVKSVIQMAIGLWALFELVRQFSWSQSHPSCAPSGHQSFCYGLPQSSDVLNLTGDALAAAAAVELVYTLFTKGPDEALDPLMLGLSAAALLSLGSVSGFNVKDGVTLLLYTVALGVLFLIKKYLAEKTLHKSTESPHPKAEEKVQGP
jgi:hypothetical protein